MLATQPLITAGSRMNFFAETGTVGSPRFRDVSVKVLYCSLFRARCSIVNETTPKFHGFRLLNGRQLSGPATSGWVEENNCWKLGLGRKGDLCFGRWLLIGGEVEECESGIDCF